MPSFLRLIFPLLFLALATPVVAQFDDAAPTSETKALSHDEIQRFIPSFVLVKYHFKRSEEKAQGNGEWSSFDAENATRYASFLAQKRPLYAGGIAIATDEVLTFDALLQDEYLDYIEIDNLRGGISRATRQSRLLDSPGMILKADDPAKLQMQPIAFAAPPANVSPEDAFYSLLFREENGKALFASNVAKPVRIVTATGEKMTWLPGGAHLPLLSSARSVQPNGSYCPVLILNADKKPLGLGLPENVLNAAAAQPPLWYGKDLLSGRTVSLAQMDEIQKKAERDFDAMIAEVKITFRQKTEDKHGGYFDFPDTSVDAPQEVYTYGLPVSEKLLFIPKRLSRNLAKVIDRITVSVNGRDVSGKFSGAFSDVGAFLIELDKPILKPASGLMQKGPLPTVAPLLTIHAERKYGRKSIQTHYDRVLHSERGYKDILEPVPLMERSAGVYFVDMDGRLYGTLLEQRREDEEKEQFREGERGLPGNRSGSEFQRVYSVDELAGHFAAQESLIDKTVVWLPEEEEKRKLWLGVEFGGMDRNLARAMQVEKITRDGQVGLVVSAVYSDSPAAKLGVKPGDILLKLQAEGEKEPIELKLGMLRNRSFDFSDVNQPSELGAIRLGRQVGAPWPDQRNMLTDLLEVIGEGRTVLLTLATAPDGKEQTKKFTIQRAPHDFSSAPKYKDKTAGLTVKDITYEIRHVYQLPSDFQGVVVSDIEEGFPASIARVEPYELITRINNAPVANVKAFRTLMNAALGEKKTGKTILRFTLQKMDRTRFADVTVE